MASSKGVDNFDNYTKVKDLGTGTFGRVILCKEIASGDDVALKMIKRDRNYNKYLEAEILNLRKLTYHPHIIQFREVFLTKDNVCLAMEYASGGDLLSYVRSRGNLTEHAARWFFQQLIIALDYCHRQGVVNRDVKLENTLLQEVPGLALPLLKICDFGYSKEQNMSVPKSLVGTLTYMAPEVLKANGAQKYDGTISDVWSCGVMLYAMLFGRFPFGTPKGQAGDLRKTIEWFAQNVGSKSVSIPENVSAPCRHLLERMLTADPETRVKLDEIKNYPWFLDSLPTNALNMNKECIEAQDWSDMQTEQDIRAILLESTCI